MKIPFETFKGPICRGCFEFNSACGHCEKCLWVVAQRNQEVGAKFKEGNVEGADMGKGTGYTPTTVQAGVPLNNYNMVITPFTITKALMLSGLQWRLPLAQVAALEANALSDTREISIVLDGKSAQIKVPQTLPSLTLFGIPFVIDTTLPDGVIELRDVDMRLVSRIENLAVPVHMSSKSV